MTAEQLRNSILQEAISGRLVPQDPNDEPASALLARIREEKVRLVKEGKLKKKDLVETPITEDEIPFEIPSSWIWVRYQDIADCALGKTKNPNQTEGELCQYLCSINVYWDSVRLNVLKEMLFSDADKQKYSVEKGDMLICEGGEAGRTAIYEGNINPLYYQNALHRVRFYGDICARFYLYQMELYKKTGLLTEHIKGETIQHFVSAKLLNLPIPLPPLPEQKRIVAKLEELLPIVEQYGKAQKELDELNTALPARLRQSILQEAISGRLVSQDENEGTAEELLKRIDAEKQRLKLKTSKKFESLTIEDEPFDIPETWRWCLLGDLAAEDMGKTPPRGESIYWEKAIYPWVSIADMKDYGLIKTTKEAVSEHAAQKAFRNISPIGSLLMSFKLTVGRTSILDIEAYHNEAIITIKPYVDENYAFRNYLFYILPLIANMGDSKDAIKGKTLNSTSLYALPIPLPPLAEQQRIVAKIEELFEQIDKISK